jgi:hypothetical protein
MELARLEQMLERPDQAPFYDLLGGLADNLVTIGTYAGTFLECNACGDTFTLKGESWKCECCGQEYALKFESPKKRGGPLETVKVSGLTKPGCSNPHWYYDNENWSVAEFMTQILRLKPEEFVSAWLRQLGVAIESPALETILCWPRFRFGGKTIQPDVAFGFRGDVVLFEFKRPGGGRIPPDEVMGQLCFAAEAARQLGRRWHLVLVPGKDSAARSSSEYIEMALADARARVRWEIPEPALADIQSTPQSQLSDRLQVLGWESLLQRSLDAIHSAVPESWSREQALTKLQYFHASRVELGLLSPPVLRRAALS